MDAEDSKKPDVDFAVENLALESHVPIDDVSDMYEKELVKLKIGAQISAYIPIFAIRSVRKMLKKRKTGNSVRIQTTTAG